MRFALLGSADSWYAADISRAAQLGGHTMEALPFSRIATEIFGTGQQVRSREEVLGRFDGLLVRSMPPGSLEQVVFRMDALAQLERSGTVVLNPPRGLEAAIDKYLSLAQLAAAGMRVPATIVCQDVDEAMNAFDQLGGNVVVKPLFGGEGRGMMHITDESLAERTFRSLAQLNAVLYLQQFIDHGGCDIRLLVVGDRVLGMRRKAQGDWRTNISRGAQGEPYPVDDQLEELARQACGLLQTPLAGVDLLPGRDGNLYLLEVNAVPGWRALSRILQVDVASLVIDFLANRSLSRETKE